MKSGLAWPVGITAILGGTVAANLLVLRLANNDPSFAVEPDYYRKAIQYDSTMAQERRNLALGWQATAMLAPIATAGETPVRITLRDAAGHTLTGAHVAVMARFNARANDTLTTVLREDVVGEYVAALPIRTPGAWELRIDAVREASRLSVTRRVTAVRQSTTSIAP